MKTFCGYFNIGVCKSCDLITMDYRDQISEKESALLAALINIQHPSLSETVTSPQTQFRNKAKLVVTGSIDHPVLGLWGEDNLDTGRELLECGLHVPEINAALNVIKDFIRHARLEPYQIATKKGELKGVILFYSSGSGESYLRFVMRSKEAISRIVKHSAQLKKFSCVSVNIQPLAHAVLEGEEEVFITEKTSITHKFGDVSISLGPRAFVQTNQKIAEKLYSTAAKWVSEERDQKFLELFCGQGAFSFFCAPFVKQALGIEINEQAVIVANATAENAGLKHLNFKSADAATVSEEISNYKPDVILVNPPRRGLGKVVDLLIEHRPERILYSSCNYETLAQDLKTLDAKYSIEKIQIFDMFPNTSHFETLVLLKLTK